MLVTAAAPNVEVMLAVETAAMTPPLAGATVSASSPQRSFNVHDSNATPQSVVFKSR